jgi:hypothetical protein
MTQTLNDLRVLYLYCRERHIKVDPHTAALAIRSVGDYSTVRADYVDRVTAAITAYLSSGKIGTSKTDFKRAIATAFVDAFETGWVEGQGIYSNSTTYDPDPDDMTWLASRTDAEFGFVDQLFVSMKEMLKEAKASGDPIDVSGFASERASGYAKTLDSVYAQGKLRGKKNIMLTLDGEDGKESCSTCQKYKGQRHRAKWWLSRDLIPGPGNTNYDCNGYNCEHKLFDDYGFQWAGSE